MLSRSEQLQFLANDVVILETLFANAEGEVLTVPGKYFPDGEPFSISLAGVEDFTGELRKQAVDTVRSQWDARDSKQNAEKAGDEEASRLARGRNDQASGDGSGSPVAETPSVQEAEGSLDEILEARKRALEETLDYALFQYCEAQAFLQDTERKLNEVIQCISVLQSVSPPTSTDESSQPEAERKASEQEQSG